MLALCLTACAEFQWTRAGSDAAAAASDLELCRQQALLDARRTLPLQPSQPTVTVDRDGRASVVRPPPATTDRFLLEQDLAAACMRGKGYQRTEVPR